MKREQLRDEAEWTAAMLPDQPPAGTLETLLDRGMLSEERLLYQIEYVGDGPEWVFDTPTFPKKKMVSVTCTDCGHTGYFDYHKRADLKTYGFINYNGECINDGNDTLCPFCGAEVKALRATSFNGTARIGDAAYPVTLHNVNGHLCVCEWCYEKNTDRFGNVHYTTSKNEAVMVIGDKLFRAAGWYSYYWNFKRAERWEIKTNYDEHIVEVKAENIMPVDKEAVYGSNAANSAIDEYLGSVKSGEKRFPGCYLTLWLKYPHIENLVRSGLSGIVNDVIDDCTVQTGYYYSVNYKLIVKQTATFIDWKKKKPHEMLHVEKEELPALSKIGIYRLPIYALARAQHERPDIDSLVKLDKNEAGRAYWLAKEQNISAVRIINYLLKGNKAGMLSDYWGMLLYVYGEIPESMRFPKDLKAQHDRVMKLKEEKGDELTNKNIEIRAKRLTWAIYAADGLMIVLPKSQKDFIKEGKKLNHCVARYAKTHAEGATTILFVRRKEKPNEPFYTLEYNGKEIVQDHGKNNKLQTPEVLAFEQKWLSYIRGGLNNGKHVDRDKTRTSAGA